MWILNKNAFLMTLLNLLYSRIFIILFHFKWKWNASSVFSLFCLYVCSQFMWSHLKSVSVPSSSSLLIWVMLLVLERITGLLKCVLRWSNVAHDRDDRLCTLHSFLLAILHIAFTLTSVKMTFLRVSHHTLFTLLQHLCHSVNIFEF